MKDYIVLDLETTGLSPKKEKIIEIGALRIRNGEVTEEFSQLICPGIPIEERITDLTGIDEKDVYKKPFFSDIKEELRTFLGEDILVGHHILFDYSFLKREFLNSGVKFEAKGIDTLRIARALYPELEKKTLEYLCSHFKIDLKAHRALEDARATYFLYEIMKKDRKQEVNELFEAKQLIFKVKKEQPITKVQKEQLKKLLERYQRSNYVELESLTRNEASRLMDEILSGPDK